MPLEGKIGNLCHRSIGRMPGDRNLLSLDVSLAIPTRVLRFEVSGPCRCTPVRPVHLTGQTGTHRSDRLDPPVRPVWSCCISVFGSSVYTRITRLYKYMLNTSSSVTLVNCFSSSYELQIGWFFLLIFSKIDMFYSVPFVCILITISWLLFIQHNFSN
jgi:hypothetical protein